MKLHSIRLRLNESVEEIEKAARQTDDNPNKNT